MEGEPHLPLADWNVPDLGHYHQRHQWVGDGIGHDFCVDLLLSDDFFAEERDSQSGADSCYTVIIATFVTVVDMVLAANAPEIHQVLGLFIPLIVVNCIILGRAEAYANKAPVHLAIADAAGMGIGFTWALTFLGSIREILGMGTIFGVSLFGSGFTPWLIFLMPPGGFLTPGNLGRRNEPAHCLPGETPHRCGKEAGCIWYHCSSVGAIGKGGLAVRELALLFVGSVLVNNFVLSRFLGICPFLWGF